MKGSFGAEDGCVNIAVFGIRQRRDAMTARDERQILDSLRNNDGDPIIARRLCDVCQAATATSGAGIMLIIDDVTYGSICVTNEVSELIEELQYTLGEGPCIDAYHQRQPVTEPDLAAPFVTRWSAFTPPAVDAGVRAVFGFPISVGTVRLGALNLYRDQPGPLSALQQSDALRFAGAAGQLIVNMQAGAPRGTIGHGLEANSDFRFVVHQAAGMIAAQLDVSVEDALIRLRASAFVNGSGISEIAADVVTRRLRFDHSDDR